MSQFHNFLDNTKFNSLLTSIALFIIIIVMIAPTGISGIRAILAKLVAIIILGYVLFTHCQCLFRLTINEPTLIIDDMFRINSILSIIFPIVLLSMICYILFTFVF